MKDHVTLKNENSAFITGINYIFKIELLNYFILQGQCTLINITVNVPELAQRAIFHL